MRVVRWGWLDALWRECAFPTEFFIKGSILRGRRADANLAHVQDSPGWKDAQAWLPHINGNALYRLGNPRFTSLVNDTMRRWDPNSGWKAFDTSLWRNLVSNYMTNWAGYQEYAHMIQYSQFIQNWSEEINEEIVAHIFANCTNTYLVHGSTHSQGDKKNNPLLVRPRCVRRRARSTQHAVR